MAIPLNRQGLPDMLRQRIITALIAGVLLLRVLFALPEQVTRLVIALLIVSAAWEWSAFLSFSTATGRYIYTALLAVSLAGIWWLVPDSISTAENC